MYTSIPYTPIELRQPTCTKYAAGLAAMLTKTSHVVAGNPLIVLTDHAVIAYVMSSAFTLTPLKQRRIQKILTAPNIQYVTEGVNAADLMLEGDPHCCETRVKETARLRADLQTTPLDGGWLMFTDGCCWCDKQGQLHAGWAVVGQEGPQEVLQVLRQGTMEGHQSAKAAELQAMVEALKWAKGEEVTIYSDSAYALGVVHIDLAEWERNGYLTAQGNPIKHRDLVMQLLQAIHLPQRLAVVKCQGHGKGTDCVTIGNDAADAAAKPAAGYPMSPTQLVLRADRDPGTLLPPITMRTW